MCYLKIITSLCFRIILQLIHAIQFDSMSGMRCHLHSESPTWKWPLPCLLSLTSRIDAKQTTRGPSWSAKRPAAAVYRSRVVLQTWWCFASQRFFSCSLFALAAVFVRFLYGRRSKWCFYMLLDVPSPFLQRQTEYCNMFHLCCWSRTVVPFCTLVNYQRKPGLRTFCKSIAARLLYSLTANRKCVGGAETCSVGFALATTLALWSKSIYRR